MKTRSRSEIDKLKAEWHADPVWDLADTPGFEAHRDELKQYQGEVRAEAERQWKAAISDGMRRFGCSRELYLHIEALERRLDDNDKRLAELEHGHTPPP